MTEASLAELQKALPEGYRLEKELARGGMSHVYLAREAHPDRPVAIKVMDGRLSDEGRERFLREVDLTSQLSHPHIVPILSAGQADGALYYVMPYIEGETLADRIEKSGSLPISDAVQIALDVARALHYAHSHGVIHRDVKPANILFQDKHALVADFGVARAHGEADSSVTREGHTLGTVEYMPPEQATGSHDIDGRADQYALACVLYEMLAGEPPFHGKTAQSTLARHLSDTVPNLRVLRQSVSDEIEGVVMRALQKSPHDRFQSVEEFADALGDAFSVSAGRLTRPTTTAGHRPLRQGGFPWVKVGIPAALMIVVALVFRPWPGSDARGGTDGGYLTSVAVLAPIGSTVGPSDGTEPDDLAEALSNSISNALSRAPMIKPTPFYTVRALQRENLTVPELLERLDVEHILQGTLTLQRDSIVIQMGHVDDGARHEEGQTFRIPIEDWLDEQPRIARDIAQEFVTRFGGGSSVSLGLLRQSAAQLDYLKGNRFLGRRTADGIRGAIDAYWTAIEKDSTYAPAFAQLSSAYALALNYRYDIGMDEYVAAGLAEALATQAIELNPIGASGYVSLSYLQALAAGPTANAVSAIARAGRLEPGNPSVSSWSARVYSLQGDHAEALREAKRAAELDQLGSGRQFGVAYQAFQMGQHEVAVEYSDRALDLEPDLMLPRVVKARALVLLGRPAECLGLDLGPQHAGTRALCVWESGNQAGARGTIDSLEASFGTAPIGDFTAVTVAEDMAVFYAYIGDAEASLEWIRTAYELSPTGVELRVVDSDLFDRVVNESGFQFTVNRLRGELWDRVMVSWVGPLVRPDAGS